MQRRFIFLTAVALVALVLIPSAALAAGFSSGFGPKSSPLGPRILSQGAPDGAGNTTALRARRNPTAPVPGHLPDQPGP